MHILKKILKKIFPSIIISLIKNDIKLIYDNIKKKRNHKKLVEIVENKVKFSQPIWIELGSATPRKNWITIDLSDGADICLDLSSSFPIKENTVDLIYTSHLLEHFHYHQLLGLLNELKRILKTGGILNICVPNAKIFIEAYHRHDESLLEELNKSMHFEHSATRIDLINYIAHMGGAHKYMFEKENLIAVLMHLGFRNVALRDFDPNLDLEVRKDESIYVVAEK